MIPAALRTALARHLSAPIMRTTPVGGGDISAAARVETAAGSWLIKWRTSAPADFFAAEADGLQHLRQAGTLPVPGVLAYADAAQPAWIALEWLASSTRYDPAALGQGLAALHRQTGPHFGWHRDNFIGSLPQPNAPSSDWPSFWRDQRLAPQVRYARQAGRISGERAQRLEQLMQRVPALLDHQPAPALLHGDLWSGNVITTADGQPALIDPAVSYGDRETDLAFAALFGGFGAAFFDAYSAAWPLPAGWQQRRPLYQLYWLLVHLTLFGAGYGSSVDRVLAQYT